LNLDKPRGITSQDAVTRVKRIFGVEKAGHAGTLDPIATGVLLVCLGEATKITRFLMDLPKEYLATLKFGERTDTLDAEGRVVETCGEPSFGLPDIEATLERFRGTICQTPPMYSALKVSGSPLYRLARRGVVVERQEREVNIYSLEIEAMDLPYVRLRVLCSRGTYIRTLVDDIGRAMGTFAHMAELRRLGVGEFKTSRSASLDELPGKQGALCPVDDALGHLGELVLSGSDFASASNGRALKMSDYGSFRPGEYLRLKDPGGRLFAVGKIDDDRVKVERILHL
jgi:tRNA pseudouridine55 synthase